MRRRQFLAQGAHAALGLSLLPLAGCGARTPPSGAPAPAGTASRRELTAHLERAIPDWLRETSVPGLSIAVIQNARVAWHRGFGVKDAASNVPVSDETMFEAASMSKPAFAYVVMKLCEAGVLGLDTPLTRYTPERFLEGDTRLELITARHVLSHTTGFQNWRSEASPLAIGFTPGEKYRYSGEGYNYLQRVVTHLLRRPFEAYMQARLLEPLGMRSSGYVWRNSFARRMARPHGVSGKPMDNKHSSPADVARYGSAGALLTTALDYARFLIAVIDPGPGDAHRLSRTGVTEMLRPHVKLEGGRYPASWALGWQVFHNQDRDFIYHGGDNEGFHCSAVASVAGQSGYVVMTNGEQGTQLLTKLIVDERMQAFLAE